MVKKYLKLFFFIVVPFLVFSCATEKPKPAPKPSYAGQKIDNFLILFDASRSMNSIHNRQKKLDFSKAIVSRMNQILPCTEHSLKGALRTFGHGECLPEKKTILMQKMKDYYPEGLEDSLEKIKCAGGLTPLSAAIKDASVDIKATSGRVAVFLLTDGRQEYFDKDPMPAIKNMKKLLGDKFCMYPIQIADEPGGEEFMQKISKETGRCGFSVNADTIKDIPGMVNFIEKVFSVDIQDSDGDEIPDCIDQCANTPRGTKVDERGCPIIVKVEEPKEERIVLQGIKFDFDSDRIREDSKSILDVAVVILKGKPNVKVTIEGHTCDLGSERYNQGLSERRAMSTKKYLVDNGIESYRLDTIGMGERNPMFPNINDENRKKNRRIEFIVHTE